MRRYTVELWEADGEPDRMPDAIITVAVKNGIGGPGSIWQRGRAVEAAQMRADRIRYQNTREPAFKEHGTDWADWYVREHTEARQKAGA